MNIIICNCHHLVDVAKDLPLKDVSLDHLRAEVSPTTAGLIAFDSGNEVKILKNRYGTSHVIMPRAEFKDFIYSLLDLKRL